MDISEYQRINSSYKRSLVFHFGPFGGFYSEYNNMLKAMALCLVHGIRFRLYSKDAPICEGGGWKDFFEVFTEDVQDDIHHTINTRYPRQSPRTAFFSLYLKRKIKSFLGKENYVPHFYLFEELFRYRWYKMRYRFSYLTSDLWDDFECLPLNKVVTVENIFHGSYRELLIELNRLVWKFNMKTKSEIDELISGLALPAHYLGMHIRAGDKCSEAAILPPKEYVSAAKKLNLNNRNVFVFTDDYSCIEWLHENFPEYTFSTLCKTSERGYYYNDLMANNSQTRHDRMIRMFASVEILKNTDYFIGTESSNPFFSISLSRQFINCFSLD